MIKERISLPAFGIHQVSNSFSRELLGFLLAELPVPCSLVDLCIPGWQTLLADKPKVILTLFLPQTFSLQRWASQIFAFTAPFVFQDNHISQAFGKDSFCSWWKRQTPEESWQAPLFLPSSWFDHIHSAWDYSDHSASFTWQVWGHKAISKGSKNKNIRTLLLYVISDSVDKL